MTGFTPASWAKRLAEMLLVANSRSSCSRRSRETRTRPAVSIFKTRRPLNLEMSYRHLSDISTAPARGAWRTAYRKSIIFSLPISRRLQDVPTQTSLFSAAQPAIP